MINKTKLAIPISVIIVSVCLVWFGSEKSFAALVPGALIRIPQNENAIIVEKKSQMLYVYSAKKGLGSPTFQAPCSTGANPGPKTRSGDKRTPEGVYFLKDEFEDRYLTPVYGEKAFTSDYPNFFDLRLGKQGSAIWIHGTDKILKPMDSNGCVALENKNIIALSDYIHLDATPLIIVDQINYAPTDTLIRTQKKINEFLKQWAKALAGQSYHTYLSFYDSTYLPDISWWEAWLGMRDKVGAQHPEGFDVVLENTGIYTQGGIVVVLCDMSLSLDDSNKIYLGKRQFFIRQGTAAPLIVGDFFQTKDNAFNSGETPLLAASRMLFPDESTDKLVVETVQQWMAAWSSKNMDKYARFYTNDFICDGMGKTAWVKRKKQLAQKYDYILVTGKNFKAFPTKDGYTVSFVQYYKSSGYSTHGKKQLKLVRQDGEWKIFRENWKGK
ncbi:L,D-transpeptidase family protein [uncultured Desulfobacter sp.]|uniref:L,D-transpeptidase family protein n=1 Tax=uncultured Desulfobacter sp. TaxID=240139 RepID=UPI0029F51A54|nr:L,D-transpeptidase family protein [uncultured Desulfobacter sp.]